MHWKCINSKYHRIFYHPFFLQEKHAKEEEERKRRIQLYVFVLRCVAYNFNAKQPNDMQKRHLKVTKEGHEKMKAKIEVHKITYLVLPRDVSSGLNRDR